ncbi:Putative L-ascorbate peroxidase 6 [Linum perenne]
MKPLSITRPKPYLLCSSSPTRKSPATSRRMSPSVVDVRCNSVRNSDTGTDCDCVSGTRRRMLVSISTLPFLMGLEESLDGFNSSAAERLETDASVLIRGEVRKVMTKGKAAGVLRLAFHDAGTFEISGKSGNFSAESIHIVLQYREPDAEGRLPEETLDASGLKQCFQRKGFSTQELVALSGAHTLGSKGFGNPVVFDNSYYKILLQKPWMSSGGMTNMVGLPSDRALVEDDECLRWIEVYAGDQEMFFQDFKNAYIKLVNSGATWKSS